MKLTENQVKLMMEEMVADLVEIIIQQWNCTLTEAMAMLYNSDTFRLLQDANTGLYYQSPGYVYSCLDNELRTGRVQ